MKKELQDKLIAEFPSLLHGDIKPNFECGDGWEDLLRRLFARLTETKLPIDYKISYAKQKYASLDVWGFSDLEPKSSYWIRDIISEFEQESYTICEQCGSTHGVEFFVHNGWEQVGCYLCREKIKSGWNCEDEPHQNQDDVMLMMKSLTDKFNDEIASKFPEGTTVKVILRTLPKKSYIVVKTPDGKVCGF